MTRAYYNEIDEYCCNWLANLMLAGLIAEGDIDQRSIRDVTPGDLRGYDQCHFFAGLGGWSLALRLAGWPDARPVWTGSCPCQPFSVAGKQKGFDDDERHLWPDFYRHITHGRPDTFFGEQVAKAPEWLDIVRRDVEALDYALGVSCIEAASAGADHLRDRYFFVADSSQQQQHGAGRAGTRRRHEYSDNGICDVADSDSDSDSARAGRRDDAEVCGFSQTQRQPEQRAALFAGSGQGSTDRDVAHHDGQQPGEGLQRSGQFSGPSRYQENSHGRMADDDDDDDDDDDQRPQIQIGQPGNARAQQLAFAGDYIQHMVNSPQHGWGEGWAEHELRSRRFSAAVANCDGRQYIECPDGKWRRLPPPRVRWLGNGIPARVAKLRAIGNAIDPRPASKFITAYMEITQ